MIVECGIDVGVLRGVRRRGVRLRRLLLWLWMLVGGGVLGLGRGKGGLGGVRCR